MKTRDLSCELNILVGGRPVSEYEHTGNIFVEGRKGSEFEIEYKNQTRHRVLVIPAVDGKSVFDGNPATPDSKGYVVPAWGSVRIPGWTLDAGNVAKFTFEDKEQSYASLTAEVRQSVQAGVVGVLVYQEKVGTPAPSLHHHHYHPINPTPWSPTPYPMWYGAVSNSSTMGTLSSSDIKGIAATRSATPTSASNAATLNSSGHIVSNAAPVDGSFDMGTGFGAKSDFKTNEVKFQKGDMTAQMVMFYDSRRNLEKRGIHVARREQRYLSDLPQAFSGLTGCTPPPGWNG